MKIVISEEAKRALVSAITVWSHGALPYLLKDGKYPPFVHELMRLKVRFENA